MRNKVLRDWPKVVRGNEVWNLPFDDNGYRIVSRKSFKMDGGRVVYLEKHRKVPNFEEYDDGTLRLNKENRTKVLRGVEVAGYQTRSWFGRKKIKPIPDEMREEVARWVKWIYDNKEDGVFGIHGRLATGRVGNNYFVGRDFVTFWD